MASAHGISIIVPAHDEAAVVGLIRVGAAAVQLLQDERFLRAEVVIGAAGGILDDVLTVVAVRF